ncbi:MAG: phosphotransferase, partial [Planctomycetota bacterium]
MRISLLQEREPFAEILQQTLAEYWGELYGGEYQVEWVDRGQSPSKPAGQEWLANIYLNAIFRPDVDSQAFDPIQREYGRSVVAWKAPIQRQYVRLATSRIASRVFSQARMFVSPEIEDSKSQLIIPGNQKIRILNHRAGTSTCLLKNGFSDEAFKNEIRARQLAAQHDVPVPRLDQVSDRWFTEQYVSATPLNRLDSPERVSQFLKNAVSALKTFVSQTQQQVLLSDYTDGLVSEMQSYVGRNNRYKPQFRDAIQTRVHDLQQLAMESADADEEVVTAETHGDFQPANILVRDEDYWLIDWENSRRRQSSYDLF